MADVVSSSTSGLLRFFHETLDVHFSNLREARASSTGKRSPVFALEHDLVPDDLALLKDAVRAGVRAGLSVREQVWWLPFVVYAAESGYDYVGDEYWRTFEQGTPGWRDHQRPWIKKCFQRFAKDYSGAEPQGAFADFFKIIAWPITHAVLPIYLQRQLAQLLYEYSGALTSELLDDPHELGCRLSRRAMNYSERFRVFCQNTSLVGQVAAALLSGESESMPYLTGPTLARIVQRLSEERQARHWLKSARASASRVRGFRLSGSGAGGSNVKRLPRATDPRLILRRDNVWNAYAELPDMTVLGARFPEIYDQLRVSRTSVNGGMGSVPPSTLLYSGQEVRLVRWPRADRPFLQLERGDDESNRILSDQCVISKGPWWLFRRQGAERAIEVRGKFIRPGRQYLLVGADSLNAPSVPWCAETSINVQGVRAYELTVPPQLPKSEELAILEAGLAIVSNVQIRPLGIVPSAWDGEGEAEWLAGEPVILGIRTNLEPRQVRVVIDGETYRLRWTPGEAELIFTLEGLAVGTHEVVVALLGDKDRQLESGLLAIIIRDPQVRPPGASAGEGIRLLSTPAGPTLAELWDGRATITIDGPVSSKADIGISLYDDQGSVLTELRRTVQLPVGEIEWQKTTKSVRDNSDFKDAYDAAESCVLTIAHHGIGFASLTCERGFQPLRWRFSRNHDGVVIATLVDRTDGGKTSLDFYDVGAPLTAVPMSAAEPFAVSPYGGLAIARVGDAVASAILPTNPNELMRKPQGSRPIIRVQPASVREVLRLAEGHRRWVSADLPVDVFAAYEQQKVADAIAREIGMLVGGRRWATVERKLIDTEEALDHLDNMRNAVGNSPQHKALAKTIAYSLHKWPSSKELRWGFREIIAPHLTGCSVVRRSSEAHFLLMLAACPGYITGWEHGEVTYLLEKILKSPVLYRAARFAVLGTRAVHNIEGLECRL